MNIDRDIDLRVELERKKSDPNTFEAVSNSRSREAELEGRRLSTFIDFLCWPEQELLLFLRSRSAALHIRTSRDPILDRTASRIIFEGAVPEVFHR